MNEHAAISREVVETIERVLREFMGPYGLRRVGVSAGEDHDGTPVIFVVAEYDLSETPVDLGVTTALVTRLRDRLWELGEARFPHVHHAFDERQALKSRRKAHA